MDFRPLLSNRGPCPDVLLQRQALFQLIQKSHMRWICETTDPGIKDIHRSLADVLEIVMEQYDLLIHAIEPTLTTQKTTKED